VLLAVVQAVFMTAPAYLIGMAIDRITPGGVRSEQFMDAPIDALEAWFVGTFTFEEVGVGVAVFFGTLIVAIWLVRWCFETGATYLMQRLGQLVVHDLRRDIYRHITGMDQGFLHNNPVGRLVNRTTFDVQSLSDLFANAFAQGFRDLLFIAILIAVMMALDPMLALILLGSFPALVAIAWLYRTLARPALRTNSAVVSRMNAWLAENISGMRENQLYRQEDRRRAEMASLTNAHQASITRVIQSWAFLRPSMMFVMACTTALVLWVGYGRVTTELISLGVLMTFLQYTARLWVPVRNLTEKVNVIQTALTSGERVFDVLETPTRMRDRDGADLALHVERGDVSFENVRFSYPGTDEEVLHEISFEIAAGDMLALVGDTGAGKSTIAHLISRFYDADSGSVKVDGHDVRDYTLRQLRRGIALVPQDVVIFAGTIRDNITLGIDVTDERVMECAAAVCADELIDRFEDGLDHVMDEGGRTLSAGERQLLSFARALVFNPPILLLHEATASVDTRTEALVQSALARLTEGRTTIVIAHRLSTIRHADQILVMRRGNIVERGSHDDLMEQDGVYAQMVRSHYEG
jgi:ABC-type multidrug transport system fused ATPase/permease subunit